MKCGNGFPELPPGPSTPASATNAGTYTGQWVPQGGGVNLPGVYGTKGTGSTSNLPGGRWAAASATDATGANVYLFGGQGIDSAGSLGLLSDLWKYNIASRQWTWVAGPSLINTNGVYGTKGSATGGAPGARQTANMWVDTSGNVWLFGGFGFDSAGTGQPCRWYSPRSDPQRPLGIYRRTMDLDLRREHCQSDRRVWHGGDKQSEYRCAR